MMYPPEGPASVAPNNGAALVTAAAVTPRTRTPRLGLRPANYSPITAPSNQAPSPPVQDIRRTPVVQAASGGQSRGQVDENFLVAARHIDVMINAIHSDKTRDFIGRLEGAYKDLSGGGGDLRTSVANNIAEEERFESSARRCAATAPDRTPAGGIVPGVLSSPPKNPNRQPVSARERRKSNMDRSMLSSTPWGPERASADKPPMDTVLRGKANYCSMLDQQTADKFSEQKVKYENESHINRTTNTSFETSHHSWGQQAGDANRERAIYKELLATVNYKKQRDLDRTAADKKNEMRMAEKAEKQTAWQWHMKREEDKQEKERMAALWSAAAKDREKLEKAQKKANLREEKEIVKLMSEGTVPTRRVRRPKEECLVMQHVIVPPRPGVALGKITAIRPTSSF